MTTVFGQDQIRLDASRVTDYKHPIFGDVTVFHDVVIASEIVQKYEDGRAYKSRDELESYAWTVDGRWVMVGSHPADGIISERDQVSGRTVNPRYVKDLIEPNTRRPCRAGVRADLEIFNKRVPSATLEDMKNGKKQDVSIGFFFSKDSTPGVVEADSCKGEEYDYVQRNMFHDHLAAGLDNGRCPMPYCGLGADEIMKNVANDPFAGYPSFSACKADMTKPKEEGGQGYTEEQAEKVCGMLQAKHEKEKNKDSEMSKLARKFWETLMDEYEALKGEREAMKKTDKVEWWREIDWAEDDSRTVFDALPEETRNLIIEAGLCPDCPDSDEEPSDVEGDEEDESLPYEDGEALDFTLTPVDEKPEPESEPEKKPSVEDVLKRAERVLAPK